MDVQTSRKSGVIERTPERSARGLAIQLWIKRAIDVVLAVLALVVLLPLLAAIGVAVRWSSPGPMIFCQQRVGRNGRPFTLYKFRTMVIDNDPSLHRDFYVSLVHGQLDPSIGTFKIVGDPRVTPIGRILRRFSLDELPQLINVLKNEMSLVGPRPPIPYEVELYSGRELERLRVTPGLTGLWQISGRGSVSFQQMIELDLVYINQWSLGLDLRILFQTPWVVVNGRGAA
jgi:lipopolysaccharide/colanic/teichoic acid biosynthesis glycosyltransferase